MLRSGILMLAALLGLTMPGGAPDSSFHDQMLPVKLQEGAGQAILVARYEVTVGSWQQCYREHGCAFMPRESGSDPRKPVTGVNWFDVNEYLKWANARAGGGLRLPTLAEWRYLNRSLATPEQEPVFTDPRLEWAAKYGQEQSPGGPVRLSGSYSTTPDGIADLDGNVWEWTSTCYKPGFTSGPQSDCPAFFATGAHEAAVSVFIRNPAAGGCATGTPPTHLGFRLVMDQ